MVEDGDQVAIMVVHWRFDQCIGRSIEGRSIAMEVQGRKIICSKWGI